MVWKLVNNVKSSCGLTEKFHYRLFLEFPIESWNKEELRPILDLYFTDYKANIHHYFGTRPKVKMCDIKYFYFQNHPKVTFRSGGINEGIKRPKYKYFTLEYCKQEAVNILERRFLNLFNQLKTKQLLLEKI
jgi:hypothetical protein